MAIDVNQLRKGTTFTEDNQLFKVIDYQHIKPGRGSATIRVKVRNLRSGSIVEMTYPSGNTVQDIRLDNTEVEYLYDEGEFVNFMDKQTFEQPQLRRDVFDEDFNYLKPGMVIAGPAVIDRMGDSIVLPSFADAAVDAYGNVVVTLRPS